MSAVTRARSPPMMRAASAIMPVVASTESSPDGEFPAPLEESPVSCEQPASSRMPAARKLRFILTTFTLFCHNVNVIESIFLIAQNPSMPSLTVENYLKAILQLVIATSSEWISTGELAEAVHVSPGTVTSMLKTLSDSGLIRYKPY